MREYRFPHIPFHPAAEANLRPFGAPPSNGRRENAAHRCLPSAGRAATGEYPFFPPYRHFERMREIFFVRGQAKWEDNGKREAPCSLRLAITVFPAN